MHNSKLHFTLKSLDVYETNRLRKFLTSPYFNVNETITEIFEVILTKVEEEYSKPDIWDAIHPGLPYDDVRFRKYTSDLLKLIQEFFAQEHLQNSSEKARFLLEAVERRGIEKLYNGLMRHNESVINREGHQNSKFFFDSYQFQAVKYKVMDYEIRNRSKQPNIEPILHNLDAFFLAEKLKFICTAKNWEIFAGHKFDLGIHETLINLLEVERFRNIPAIRVYHLIYQTLLYPDQEEYYFELKEDLVNNWHLFPIEEARDTLFKSALNYCTRKGNRGVQKFLGELFNLYRFMIEKRIIFVNDELSPWDFKNIVTVGLRIGEYEWIEEFITNYQEFLPARLRSNSVTFNLARLHWYKKDHKMVIELLREVEYEDITYNLGSKSMLIATYYETDEIEPLYSLLESFRTYLNRHKEISENRRRNYKNLIRFTKKMTKIIPGDKEAIQKLRSEIEEKKNIADVKWLKEKLNDLEGATG